MNRLTEKKIRYSLKEQVSYLFSGKVIALAIQMAIPLILVRLINREEYGLYLQFLLIGQFLSSILIFSIPTSLYFFVPNAGDKKDQLISQTYFAIVFMCLIFLPLYYLLGPQLSVFIEIDTFNRLYYPLGLYICFCTTSLMLEHLFVVEKKSNYVISYNVLSTLLRVTFLILAFITFKTIISLIWALVLLRVLMSGFLFFYLRANYRLNPDFRFWDKPYFLSQVKYTVPLAMASVVNNIGKNADKFILSAFFSASDFAIYSIANYKVPIVNLLFPSVSNVIVPQISKYRAEGNIAEVKRLWHKMIVVLSNVTIPTAFFFF